MHHKCDCSIKSTYVKNGASYTGIGDAADGSVRTKSTTIKNPGDRHPQRVEALPADLLRPDCFRLFAVVRPGAADRLDRSAHPGGCGET
ncbi:hypothetical protein GCM10022223_33170 [Kineosporia mesophila]|uniref:Uncharacterized protein n=1 Tax=Kineosporia mesophila TaxID=566012 RepID=A0ABP6ZMF0_9ACTN